MKMITAVVRPFKLDELRQAIAQLGVQGVTVTEVHEPRYGPRIKLEIAVDDPIAEAVLEALTQYRPLPDAAATAASCSAPIEQAIRIRTRETGPAAT